MSCVVELSDDDLDRHLWLQLPRMEGQLLSSDAAVREDAAVLRRAVPDGRDQLHVLPRAEREDSRRLEQGDPRHIQADAEGAEAHHARSAAERLRGAGAAVLRDRGHAWPEDGRAAVPASSQSQEESCAVRRVPRDVSAARVRRVRVSPRVVAGRRRVRAAPRT